MLSASIRHVLLLALALTMLGGCRAGEGTGGGTPTGGTMREGLYYMEPGAPDPLACTSDADCVADVVVRKDGCCMVNNPYAQTRAWRDWLQRTRNSSSRCSRVKCDTSMRMAPPPSCASDVHCVAGRCADSCR